MGGGVDKGATKVCVSLQRGCEFWGCGSFGALKGSQGCPERPPGGLGKLSRSILELTWELSLRSPRAASGDCGDDSRD